MIGKMKAIINNRKTKAFILLVAGVLIILGLIKSMMLFAAEYEFNFARYITINQNGGSGAVAKWMFTVDNEGYNGEQGGSWYDGLGIGGTYWSNNLKDWHEVVGYDNNENPRTDGYGFLEHTDCVGVTPRVWLSNPTRQGFIFAGWSSGHEQHSVFGGTAVEAGCWSGGDFVITANWTPITYYVSYNGNGATAGSMSTQTMTFGYGYNLNALGFERKCTLTYNGNGGTPSSSTTVANSTFLGWSDYNSINIDGYNLSWQTFMAPYYYNSYSDIRATFGYNKEAMARHWLYNTVLGGENRRASPYFDLDQYYYNYPDLRSAFGYNWYSYVSHYQSYGYNEGRVAGTTDNVTSIYYPNQAWVANMASYNGENLTLYANWQYVSVQLTSASRVGYTFDGWYADAGLTNKVGNAGDYYTPTSNVTLYAKWKPNKYKVTFYDVLYNEDGKNLGKKEEYIDYATVISGAYLGTDTTPGIYYKDKYLLSNGTYFNNDLYYSGCTSATVTTDGATVYRFFARSLAVAAVIEHNDGRDGTCPTGNNFTTGEKAVLKITTFGYADSVDISYPTEFLNARAYGTIPKIKNQSITLVPDKIATRETTFTIPLYDVVEGLYSININANRSIDNSVATTTPSLSIGKDLLKDLKNTIKSYPSTKW